MNTPRVQMKDAAWVWYDHSKGTHVAECHICNQRWETGPELYDGSDTGQVAHWWAVLVANLHNRQHHKEAQQWR